MSTTARVTTRRNFLCCIPVRAGVVFLSLLGVLGSALVAAIAIIQLKRAASSKVSLILQVVIYILLAMVSVFGLIGAINRKLGFIRLYLGMLVAHLLISIGIGTYAIYHNFKDAPNYIAECASNSNDPAVLKSCQDGANLWKGCTIGIFILAWLLEIWACRIVHQYSRQLVDEAAMTKNSEHW